MHDLDANDNFIQCRQALDLSADHIVTLARNSLVASFVPPASPPPIHAA